MATRASKQAAGKSPTATERLATDSAELGTIDEPKIPKPTPKAKKKAPAKAKAAAEPTAVETDAAGARKPKADGYSEVEDEALVALVTEHGRSAGVREFTKVYPARSAYGVDCHWQRLKTKAKASGVTP